MSTIRYEPWPQSLLFCCTETSRCLCKCIWFLSLWLWPSFVLHVPRKYYTWTVTNHCPSLMVLQGTHANSIDNCVPGNWPVSLVYVCKQCCNYSRGVSGHKQIQAEDTSWLYQRVCYQRKILGFGTDRWSSVINCRALFTLLWPGSFGQTGVNHFLHTVSVTILKLHFMKTISAHGIALLLRM